jgi:hypothetical protein
MMAHDDAEVNEWNPKAIHLSNLQGHPGPSAPILSYRSSIMQCSFLSLIKYCVSVATTLIYEYTCAQIGEEVSSSCNPSPHPSPLTSPAISNEPETFHSCEAGSCAPSLDEKEGSRKKLNTPRGNCNSPIAIKEYYDIMYSRVSYLFLRLHRWGRLSPHAPHATSYRFALLTQTIRHICTTSRHRRFTPPEVPHRIHGNGWI